ncbi:MAG: UvrD-helicase domain-containing protein, partial [Chloroflexi bacterium]|nr:UvrD-helicase domain-containing protein [Chloroflexota bacterium]
MRDTARDRIVGIADGSLSETIYAGAGAGTGKTQALVERIANLVIRGGVKPENIVAITFTVAAASELRQRVREELEERLAQARSARGESAGHESALGSALESLDSAFIGTIHSFAQSLLREWPLGVGLPPVFELLDSVQGDTRFDDEWDEWLEGAFSQPEFSRAVIGAQQLGLRSPLATLRDLAAELHASYDLVERVGELPQHTSSVVPRTLLSSIRSDLAKAIDLRDHCANPDDLLLSHLDTTIVLALSWIDEALDSDSDEECVLALTQLEKLSSGSGRKGDWSALAGGDSSLDEVRALLNAAQQTLESGRQSLGEATVVPLINAVAKMVLGYADKRRTEGLLEFQDLLVLSCRLLTDSRVAREYFQARYTYILIDEFQDTDPLQLKLAMLLANRPERPDPASQTANENKNGVPPPGALFVVGDDKQSIY